MIRGFDVKNWAAREAKVKLLEKGVQIGMVEESKNNKRKRGADLGVEDYERFAHETGPPAPGPKRGGGGVKKTGVLTLEKVGGFSAWNRSSNCRAIQWMNDWVIVWLGGLTDWLIDWTSEWLTE